MLNAAIIGLGRWGRILVDSVQGRSESIRFVAGVTRTRSKAEDYARDRGFPLLGSFEEALSRPEIEAVVLATPHSQHREQIVAAARAGKPVFCEKPITLTAAEFAEARAAVDDRGIVFAAGFNRRFLPPMQRIAALLGDRTLGRLLHMEGNMSSHVGQRYAAGMWRVDPGESPAGGMAGSGIHLIDSMIHLAGPVAGVTAQSFRLVHDFTLDDTTSVLLRFAGGATGYIACLTATAPTFRFQAFGDRATAELRGLQELIVKPVDGEASIETFPPFDMERAELEAFAAAVAGATPYPVPLDDVANGVATFEAVARSAASRQPVEIS